MVLHLLGMLLAARTFNFTIYSDPVDLRYGEVHNRMQRAAPLPAHVVDRYADGSKSMAIRGYEMDIVRRNEDGAEESVPLYDTYFHHYILDVGDAASLEAVRRASLNASHYRVRLMHQNRGLRELGATRDGYVTFGGASGAEFRHNPHVFEQPFRMVVRQPTSWAPTLHMINTRRPATGLETYDGEPSALLQCPCTPQRKIDSKAGTIDGHVPNPPMGYCDDAFIAAANPSCDLATYAGGWRCCEDGVFVVDTARECADPRCSAHPIDRVYLKATFHYEDAAPDARPLGPTACCDVTSTWEGDGNIEYDVPQCAEGTPAAECVHVVSTVQPLGYYEKADADGRALIDLAFAAPHLHVTGISLELQDALTNATVCKVSRDDGGVRYGGTRMAGDERNYLTGLRPCSWGGDAAVRFEARHPMRTIATYNATKTQTGVMALWLMDGATYTDKTACAAELRAKGCIDRASPEHCKSCAKAHAGDLYASGCEPSIVGLLCQKADP
jgi:hypothetical protein